MARAAVAPVTEERGMPTDHRHSGPAYTHGKYMKLIICNINNEMNNEFV